MAALPYSLMNSEYLVDREPGCWQHHSTVSRHPALGSARRHVFKIGKWATIVPGHLYFFRTYVGPIFGLFGPFTGKA